MTDTPERDPLEELLAPPGPIDAAALRQSVLAQATRRLRRGRWRRRAALAVALAACYAAGLLTMHLSAPAAPAGASPEERPAQAAAPPVAGKADAAPVERDPEPAAQPERAALLRQEGDRCLNEQNDPETALRCYSKALSAGSEEDVKFSPDDNWLLMAIKNAREKEARHANNDG